jgi:hypothetical protein
VATDASTGNYFYISCTLSFTLNNPTNPTDGQQLHYKFRQDGAGSRILSLDTAFAFGSDLTSFALSTGANKLDYMIVEYDSTNAKWEILSVQHGF